MNTDQELDIIFGDIKDIYSEVDVFGTKMKLPHWGLDIADILRTDEQAVALWKAIDDMYPGIETAEAEMLYLHMLRASQKDAQGEYVIPDERFCTIGDKTYRISFADIKKLQESEQKFMTATYKFRCPSVLEYRKLNPLKHEDSIPYLLQYYTIEGNPQKYKPASVKDIPLALGHQLNEIVGTIQLHLHDGSTVTGLETILELFSTGEYKAPATSEK